MHDTRTLTELVARRGALVLGVGNRLRGDDAVGSLLAARLSAGHRDRVLDAGDVPENLLGPLLEAAPAPVVFVDAVDQGAEPGAWCVCRVAELRAKGVSTHGMSLRLLADLLAQHGIEAWIVAIQPSGVQVGTPVSDPVERASRELETVLAGALEGRDDA